MRAIVIAIAVVGILVGASAQTVPILSWGSQTPETSSQPSWYGTTGLVYTPSAMIGAPLKIRGGYHTAEFDKSQTVMSATVALTNIIEASATRIEDVAPASGSLSANYSDETVVSLKYKIDLAQWIGGLSLAPDLAVGCWDISDQVNRSFYVVASTGLSVTGNDADSPLKLHVGYGQSERATTVDGMKLGGLDGLFAGIEFAAADNALIQVEYDTEDINADLRYFALPWLSVDAGVIDGDFAWGLSASTPL